MKINKFLKKLGLGSMMITLGLAPIIGFATACSDSDDSYDKTFSFDQVTAKNNFGVAQLSTASMTKEETIRIYNTNVKDNLSILAADILNYVLSLVTFKENTEPTYTGSIKVEYQGKTTEIVNSEGVVTTPSYNIFSAKLKIEFPNPENVTIKIRDSQLYVRKIQYEINDVAFSTIKDSTNKTLYANNKGIDQKISYTGNITGVPPYENYYEGSSNIEVYLKSWYLSNITFSN